jgi:hypothetical protein
VFRKPSFSIRPRKPTYGCAGCRRLVDPPEGFQEGDTLQTLQERFVSLQANYEAHQKAANRTFEGAVAATKEADTAKLQARQLYTMLTILTDRSHGVRRDAQTPELIEKRRDANRLLSHMSEQGLETLDKYPVI